MKRLVALAGALVAALVTAAVAVSPTLSAQTPPESLDVCESGQRVIGASKLPRIVEPEACSLEGKIIRDNGVGSVVPAPGESVYAEALTTSGAQVLELTHSTNGNLKLENVGVEENDSSTQSEPDSGTVTTQSSPYACNDTAYNVGYKKWYERLDWYFNRSTTPPELTRNQATGAIRRGGANITSANDCGLADRVSAKILYQGNTSRYADVTSSANCTRRDGTNVVSFGNLYKQPDGDVRLATTCSWSITVPRAPAELIESDIRVQNSAYFQWTTAPTSSCNNYGLESTITHERGHSFGLNHVSESTSEFLTMSPNLECRGLERTLGRGDIYGLRQRY